MATTKIYAVCRHFQDSDSESYYQWRGNQILSYHASATGAANQLAILLAKELNISLTSNDSDFEKNLIRNNQVEIFDGVGSNAITRLEDLYHIIDLDLKP